MKCHHTLVVPAMHLTSWSLQDGPTKRIPLADPPHRLLQKPGPSEMERHIYRAHRT